MTECDAVIELVNESNIFSVVIIGALKVRNISTKM